MKEKGFVQNGTAGNGVGFFENGISKKQKIISVYVQSTGSNVRVLDGGLQPVEIDGGLDIERSVCQYCAGDDGKCWQMHSNEIQESSRQGKPQIYRCELGLMFWVSPIYVDGKFSGALRGSGYVSPDAGGYGKFCNKAIPAQEFTSRVSAFPVGDVEKIESLAQMLLLCSESLSEGGGNYHEMFRVRHEQQASLSTLVEELRRKHPEGPVLLSYPLDKERRLISVLRQGDTKKAEGLLNEILAVLVFNNRDNFPYIQLRALELAVLLTRTGTNFISATAVENNARYLKQIQEAKSIEDLTGILHVIVENVAEQIVSFQGLPHASAMRKAELFIRENLTRKISLGEIAKIAGLSAPYFSTIFKEEMGENLSSYVNRQRVEKASKLLLETDLTLSEIAASCCFQDQSWFSKIFKSFTGISPGKYRRQGGPVSGLRSNTGE
ncbi:MAG: helix-turn-helix domain-containing protein [Treponema sp.]|nr:helix-turn-helix domain-containing protein [Treponema sp.]MCL2190759.1 helix-turn-helix domain-containing protein [Treponema sp.]